MQSAKRLRLWQSPNDSWFASILHKQTYSHGFEYVSEKKSFPHASSKLFTATSPRRKSLLRNLFRIARKPGGSLPCALACRIASGSASAKPSNRSGSISPSVFPRTTRLRIARTDSAACAASAAVSNTLPPAPNSPRSSSSTPWSCSPCSTSYPASNASACSSGALSNRERSSSRGSRAGNSNATGLAMILAPWSLFLLNLNELTSREVIVRAFPFPLDLDAVLRCGMAEARVPARQRTFADLGQNLHLNTG